jgi:hypothetical protein
MTGLSAVPRLLTAIDAAYDRATECFLQDSPSSLHGVIWLSAHLAAMEQAIEASAARQLPQARETLEAQRKLGLELQRLLRTAEQQRAGDALAPHVSWPDERTALLSRLEEHARGERTLILMLAESLDDSAMERVHNRYVRVFEHGPTRPHPHGPHRGRRGTVAFRLATFWDRILDVLDSRTTPIPRKPINHPPPGHWDQYLLGTSDLEYSKTRETDARGDDG